MPKISKIRIVNFSYNDGKRLIADELYDFASKENNDALNVLINLANGGGKSVLVQLMMQPIIPKAKVAGRKIESFFNKREDHCFVLIEWLKDNSTEKLLTGIAIASSESSIVEDETSRGASVKYYTFYSNYSTYTTQYDIVNMPLSKKESGKFVAEGFDFVRSLARKSNGALIYYAADDNLKWQKKLAEYGLVQSEWKMMEDLNSEEGGLGKFFGNFKTSDLLIDKLLIPTIERKLNQNRAIEDNSLSTMLLSYARQYNSRQDVLRDRETYEFFSQGLVALRPEAEKLWSSDDNFSSCIKKMFGFSSALDAKLDECKTDQEKDNEKIKQLDYQERRIEWERASSDYYQAEEAYKNALNDFETVSEKERSLAKQLDDTRHGKLVLECADYHDKLVKAEGKIISIRSVISRREHGGKADGELDSLKYSVCVKVNEELQRYSPELEDARLQKSQLENEKEKRNEGLENARKAKDKAKDAHIRADESLRNSETETDREIGKLDFEISRRLDGMYADDELEEFNSSNVIRQKELVEKLAEETERQKSIENELSDIPQKLADVSAKRSDFCREKDAFADELEEYRQKEEKIEEICNLYNLDFSRRFTDYIADYLSSEIRKNAAEYAETVRKVSIADEEIQSAYRGSMHVPYAVIEYLNFTGVRYSTCEKYLLGQVADGKISSEQCLEVLRNYPAAAYGILMDSAEKERFFTYGREKWLPAMIPLFTHEQMSRILENSHKFDGAIAFYSEEYFADKDHYITHLEEARQKLLHQQDILTQNKANLESQINVTKSFNYTLTWKKEQETSICRLEKSIGECDEETNALNQKRDSLGKEKAAVSINIEEIKQAIEQGRRYAEIFANVIDRIKQENELREDQHKKKVALDEADRNFRQIEEDVQSLQTQIADIDAKLSDLEEITKDLNNAKNIVGECAEAEIVSGTWQELLSRYQTLQASINSELSTLNQQLDDKLDQKEELEREIRKREIAREEYENVHYSSEQYNEVCKREKQLSSELKTIGEEVNRASERKGKANGNFESANMHLSRFGSPLEKSEVGTDFDNRLESIRGERKDVSAHKEQSIKAEGSLNALNGRLTDYIKEHTRPENVSIIKLDEDFKSQFDQMVRAYKECNKQLAEAQKQVNAALHNMEKQFEGTTCGVSNAISGMLSLLSNDIRGDRYYTLVEHIDGNIQNAGLAVSKIMTDLKEFDNNHIDLIRQCTLQGQRIYEGLKQLASSSRVTVYNGSDKKQMIRFDIQSEIDTVVASAAITNEIDNGTKELVAKMVDNSVTDDELKKMADKIIGSKNLLRKYIGKDSIKVEAYKIDQNPQNAGYRTWEKTQVNNSGAEKFVVYFAVILCLMNYTRSDLGSINDKGLCSTLILDNPFGATSSKHILEPMFAIAKHFRVQMVCLSDINKSDVINCFDIVIKAIVKKRPMSTGELLTHEGNEFIEHGFYRSEQITL